MTIHSIYIDPNSGFRKSYDQFIEDLSGTDFEFGDQAYDMMVLVSRAMFHGQNLKLGETKKRLRTNRIVAPTFQVFRQKAIDSAGTISMATSGTSGPAKQVVQSVKQLLRGVRIGPRHFSDRWGLCFPLNRFAGLQVFLQAVLNQNTIVNLFGYGQPQVHRNLMDYQVTHISATPTFYRLLCAERTRMLPHEFVTQVTCGGECLDDSTLQGIREVFPEARICNIFASTEFGSLLVSSDNCFRIPDYYRDKVRVDQGQLLVHHSLLAESEKRAVDSTGFCQTGDMCQVISDDPLTVRFVARQSDFFTVGGANVNPYQVEDCVKQLPEVKDALAFPVPNPVTGNLVGCEIVLQENCSLGSQQVRQWLMTQLESFQIPRIINFVGSIDRNETGKKVRR